jgi:ketosteroid isomerase-like protein
MNRVCVFVKVLSVSALLLCVAGGAWAQGGGRDAAAGSAAAPADAGLAGVYRIDTAASDRLYSVVAGASSNLPFGEQQRFFLDLSTRLTPPDQLAIERRGRSTVNIASSRAPRTTFLADGRERREATADGYSFIRASLEGDSLTITSRSSNGEGYGVTFAAVEGGRRLRVTRRISARELREPVIIQSVYDRISEVARWEIYGEPLPGPAGGAQPVVASVISDPAAKFEAEWASALRASLDDWVAATNARDLQRQMDYYMPTVRAFYLTRDVPRAAVRAEKARVFARASTIDVSAEEPEIIFRESGRVAVMRFRKRYRIEGGPGSRRGEVVQELRWRRTDGGWKIFSERDVRVIR